MVAAGGVASFDGVPLICRFHSESVCSAFVWYLMSGRCIQVSLCASVHEKRERTIKAALSHTHVYIIYTLYIIIYILYRLYIYVHRIYTCICSLYNIYIYINTD